MHGRASCRSRLALVICIAAGPGACSPRPAPPAQPLPPAAVASVVVSAVAAPAGSSAPAPTASAPKPEPEAEDLHKVDVELQSGARPCRLVFNASMFDDEKDSFTAGMISRIATEDSPGCAAGVLYDLSKETKANPDDMEPESLMGGVFQKPGHPPAEAAGDSWNHTDDLNFDGSADLCVVVMTGAYNYSHKCWLFEPGSRKFVRNTDLDEVIHLTVDKAKKTLKNGLRVGGPQYMSAEYGWIGGRLTVLWREEIILGETPDGRRIPGKHWVVRYERKGDKLVKVKAGARKAD